LKKQITEFIPIFTDYGCNRPFGECKPEFAEYSDQNLKRSANSWSLCFRRRKKIISADYSQIEFV
jgi:hypothetical protein